MEEGTIPSETLSFKHQKFTFEDWEKLIQLDAVRELLAEGLQAHFEVFDKYRMFLFSEQPFASRNF